MKLRKWVQYLLIVIIMICIMVLGSENDNTFIFIISKLIALLISIGCAFILEKYGTLK